MCYTDTASPEAGPLMTNGTLLQFAFQLLRDKLENIVKPVRIHAGGWGESSVPSGSDSVWVATRSHSDK